MDFFVENINLVIFLPLIMCAILGFNALISNKIEKSTLFSISIVSSFVCLLFSAFAGAFFNNTTVSTDFQWISLENLSFYLGTYLDKVSVCFLLGISLILFALQILSYFKYKDEYQYLKLLFLQNLFAFSFSGIFVSQNLFQTYLFCEVLGVAGYLLINFDFSNREESRAGIKSYIFNRLGDLTLLFCVITLLYYSVVYNETGDALSLAYSNVSIIAATVNSLLGVPLFVVFCSLLIFVIIMKFMQAFVYLTFETDEKNTFSRIIFYQNSLIGMVGLFLFLRLEPFFFELGSNWAWTVLVLAVYFVAMFMSRLLFLPFCRAFGWVEKYIVETAASIAELSVRALSYLCNRFHRGNFQSYLIFSFVGLVFILGFVLAFYEFFIKV